MELWKEFQASVMTGAVITAGASLVIGVATTAMDIPGYAIKMPDAIQNPVAIMAGSSAVYSVVIGMVSAPLLLFGAAAAGGLSILNDNYKENLQKVGRNIAGVALGQAAAGGLAFAALSGVSDILNLNDKPYTVDSKQYIKQIPMDGSSDLNSRSVPPAVLIPARTHNL